MKVVEREVLGWTAIACHRNIEAPGNLFRKRQKIRVRYECCIIPYPLIKFANPVPGCVISGPLCCKQIQKLHNMEKLVGVRFNFKSDKSRKCLNTGL